MSIYIVTYRKNARVALIKSSFYQKCPMGCQKEWRWFGSKEKKDSNEFQLDLNTKCPLGYKKER